MTTRQKEIISDNLRAFVYNFGPVRIESADYGGGFYIFYPPSADSYVQYCPDISYVDGWLYGAVQGVRIIAPLKEKNGISAPIDES